MLELYGAQELERGVKSALIADGFMLLP